MRNMVQIILQLDQIYHENCLYYLHSFHFFPNLSERYHSLYFTWKPYFKLNTVDSCYSWQLWSILSLQTVNQSISKHLIGSHCSQGKCRARFLRASGHNVFISLSIRKLVLCTFLFKDTLFDICYVFNNTEIMASSTITHAQRQLIRHTLFFP